jgi:hydrophobic/amphiphilic exporter-1 (mainly G- bacteria), HAE1 family
VRDVIEVIETAVAGSRAGEYRGRQLLPHPGAAEDAEQRSLDEILDLTCARPAATRSRCATWSTRASGRGPVIIERKDQQRMITVTANVAGRDLGSVAAERAGATADPAPDRLRPVVAGNFEEQQKAFRELVLSLLLALLLVYMVLASQYESLRDPLVVMLSVPVAAVGVLLTCS